MIKYIKTKSASNISLIIFLSLIAFRLSFTENVSIESFSLMGVFFDNLLSITISSAMILLSGAWLITATRKNQLKYKYTGLEIGALLFLLAAVCSAFFASNKRASLNDAITITAAIVSAIVLVQILDSELKKKALVFFIIAAAAMNVYQCADQFASGNKMMIEAYQENPQQQLRSLGIESGSFQHMLYEHRLYSKDVKGFFATSNSAGCFFNLAIFSAIAIFAPGLIEFRKNLKALIFPALIFAVLLTGLALTASKGALISFVAAALLLTLIYAFNNFFRRFRTAILALCAVAFFIIIFLMIWYGLNRQTLPGGNSMRVRWQYWTAAAEMIADYFFTGIGGNNFAAYYTKYKIPGALETVRDPHCFILTIFSAYGIIGLAGFCTCVFLPLYRAMNYYTKSSIQKIENIPSTLKVYAIAAIWILLFLRPIAIRSELGSRVDVMVYIIAIMYVAPVFVFAVVIWLCAKSAKVYEDKPLRTAPLLCGIFAVLVHNLIDFGIFEPGILTAFFAVLALAIAQNLKPHFIQFKKYIRQFSIAASAVALIIILSLYIVPVAKTAVKVEAAKKLSAYGHYAQTINILNSALADDKFDPAPPALNGLINMYNYQINTSENKDSLAKAENAILAAIARSAADYKHYENLAEVYQLMAEAYPHDRIKWFEKAADYLHHALDRYPVSAELHLKAATVAQQLNRIDDAIEHYTQTVAIEDAYREEFKIMYPGREFFSRVGDVNYRFAKLRLEQLRLQKESNR